MACAVVGTGLLLVLLTALPLTPSTESWIRVWDFPRTQLAALLAITLISGLFVLPLVDPLALVFFGVVGLALAWQVWRIWPYTPLHRVQVEAAEGCPEGAQLKVLIANVLQGNRESRRLLDFIERHAPDVVLLVETNQWWDMQLKPLAASYPNAIRRPQENTYGMHLFSKFGLKDPQVRYLLDNEMPSIKTGITLPSGRTIVLYGVHPRPPPRADTAQRDAELVMIGQEVRRGAEPAIVAGDLNDVAWSQTTHLFQEISGLLDPRMGRGLFPTFSANWRLLRWPLDHVFFSPEFRLLDLCVLPSIGSDHFPLLVALCHQPEKADGQPAPEPERSDLARARKVIAEGKDASSN